MVIYVTLINLTEMECILLLLLLKSNLFICLCVLESLTLDKSKLYFVEMKTSKNCFIANVNVYRYSNLIKTDNYFRTNCCRDINLKQNRFEIKKKKYHMTYNIRYLAKYIGSLKVCNVRYILSYKLQNTRNAVKYSLLLSYINRMLNYVSKNVSRWYNMLTCKWNGSNHSHHFIWGNHIQQLIILKVIMLQTRCMQFWNSQVIFFSKHGM